MTGLRASAPPTTEPPRGIHAVGRPDARAEREADRVAEASVAPTRTVVGWSFAAMPAHAATDAAPDPADDRAGTVDVRFDGPGRPLPDDERMPLPPGLDPGPVRLHTDAAAEDTVARAGAQAITVGTHVAFAPGRYQPGTAAGRRRLAHELAHVRQHRPSGPPLVRRDAPGAVASATTLEGLPEADRKRLQSVTTTAITAPTTDQLTDYFSPGTTIDPGAAVSFDASVPAALAKGLGNLVGAWTRGATPTLAPNSTFTVVLDLSAHGGSRAPFRFTYTEPPAKQGAAASGRIIIEQLGAAKPPAGATPPRAPARGKAAPPDPIADKMKAASITFSGYSDPAQLRALRTAIAVVPASHLAAISGLRFARAAADKDDPKAAGKYEPDANRITMYRIAFASSAIAYVEGSVSVSYAARHIVHEIGHAVDLRPLQQAHDDLEKARAAVQAASGEFTSADEAKRYKDAVKAVRAAEKRLRGARSRSGTKTVEKKPAPGTKPDPRAPKEYEDVIGKQSRGNAFREAVKKDGKAVSTYGEEDWQEAYAESYAAFIANPTQFKAMRPATHAYLEKNLPK